MGWIAVDLDGTLAHWENGQWPEIGTPVPKMQARVKSWLSRGKTVKIFTARVSGDDSEGQRSRIETWCKENLGEVLKVTNRKDDQMDEIWDDIEEQFETITDWNNE